MSQYIIKDSQVVGPVTINADGSNTYNNLNWVALGVGVWSPSQTFRAESGIASTIQATVTGTGGATVQVSVSIDNVSWQSLGTIVLNTTSGDTGNIAVTQTWNYVRAQVSAIGASTTVTVQLSV